MTAFLLVCKECAREIAVGPIAKYRHRITGDEWTVYFEPDAEDATGPILGVSDCGGDGFVCRACVSDDPHERGLPR